MMPCPRLSRFVDGLRTGCIRERHSGIRERHSETRMTERDWSVFIGERLDAPWTSDRAGAALMPEHLRQVVLLCAASSPCVVRWHSGSNCGGTGGQVVHHGVADQAPPAAGSCSSAPAGTNRMTLSLLANTAWLLLTTERTSQDAPAANRAALDEAFNELIAKISEDDDEWVVLIGTLLKDITSKGAIVADLEHPKLQNISAAVTRQVEGRLWRTLLRDDETDYHPWTGRSSRTALGQRSRACGTLILAHGAVRPTLDVEDGMLCTHAHARTHAHAHARTHV